MEKITLKPVAKELIFKGSEPDVFFDVLSHAGSTTQEKNLGAIYVLSYLRQKDEDLGYMVSLISSLAKREFYSPQAIAGQNPKAAFERTLKKLNEVLEDFFKNKQFTLNLGLAAISGENIFISRLGKFKVALARDNEYIDILNNIELFNKEGAGEQQFSNIISGKLKPNDKIFAYFPIRQISTREKTLNPMFVAQDQKTFSEKITQLHSTTPNFACCAVHINIDTVREIPVQAPAPVLAAVKDSQTEATARPAAAASEDNPQKSEPLIVKPKPKADDQELEAPNIIKAEVSVTKRSNPVSVAVGRVGKLFAPGGARRFLLIAALVITPLVGWVALRGGSSQAGSYKQADENFRLARSHLGQNETRKARALLQAAIAQISELNGRKAEALKADIDKTLDIIDHVSDKLPTLAAEADGGKLFASAVPTQLRDAVGNQPVALYEDNLYVLSGTTIFKYADAVKGGTKQTTWGTLEPSALSLAVDGDLYALNADGLVAKYYKGKRESEFTLQVAPSADVKFSTAKDSPFLYLSEITAKKVFVFDKANGALKTTYKLDTAGDVSDIRIASDGAIWILAKDNKVWQIKP